MNNIKIQPETNAETTKVMGTQDVKSNDNHRQLMARNIHDTVVLILVAVFFTLEIYSLFLARNTIKARLPENYGNTTQVIDSLTTNPPADSFSFGVVGDTVTSPTFPDICRKFREHPLSFIVIVGDFADKCPQPYHDYFKYECLNSYQLTVPVFLVAGNRDVDYDNRNNNNISHDTFNALYGSGNFFFEYGDCLFIGASIFPSPVSSSEGIAYLEKTLATQKKQGQKVFVLTHVPPLKKLGSPTEDYKDSQKVLDIAKKYNVDYVISGHMHGYSRLEQDSTVYLVTGGGGATLNEAESFNGLHHAIVITVNSDSIEEEAILVAERKNNPSAFARFAIAKLYPLMSNNPIASIGVNILMVFIMLLTVFKLKSRKAKNHHTS